MNTLKQHFTKVKSIPWYIQGVNGVPIFLTTAAWSGITMEKVVGYRFTHFLFHYKEGYGEMHYDPADLKRLWKIIQDKILADSDYLVGMRNVYDSVFEHHRTFFHEVETSDITQLSDSKLLLLLHRGRLAMVDSVGVAHLVEPIGQEIEADVKARLAEEISEGDIKQYFVELTVPSQLSFVSREEKDLQKLIGLSGSFLEEALQDHIDTYYWIQNTYRGKKGLTISSLKERLSLYTKAASQDPEDTIIQKKTALMKRLNLSQKTQDLLWLIDFVTVWQDERKENILQAIGWLEDVLIEISRRTLASVDDLGYLGSEEIERFTSLSDIKALASVLHERRHGSYFLIEEGREYIASGKLYEELRGLEVGQNDAVKIGQQIHGSVANTGTASGKVALCINLSSLHKVEAGDVLVTSMTRPEFMPALRKVSAIVTDEGGITSHAAIVARELGIPAVIGTKVATKLLKDGMRVEVRANHGFVRIV